MPGVLARVAIRNSELFAEWPEQATELLLQHSEVIHVEAGTCVNEAGAPSEFLYLIASGSVELHRVMPSGRDLTVQVYQVGTFHGLGPVMTQTPYVQTATAKEKSVIVRIPGKVVRDLVTANGRLCFSLFKALTLRHQLAVHRHSSASLNSVGARIAEHLLLMDDRNVRQRHQHEIALSQEEIAAMLGTSRQVVNRSLQEMSKTGAVEILYGRIAIRDREKLARIADDLP